jgi:hypothetical protein
VQGVPVTLTCSISPKTEDMVGTGGIRGAISGVVASSCLRALPSKAKGLLKRLGGFLKEAPRKTHISMTLVCPYSYGCESSTCGREALYVAVANER